MNESDDYILSLMNFRFNDRLMIKQLVLLSHLWLYVAQYLPISPEDD